MKAHVKLMYIIKKEIWYDFKDFLNII